MKKTIKKLLLVITVGLLVQSAFAANATADLPRTTVAVGAPGSHRRQLAIAELDAYRDQAAQFQRSAPTRTAGARFDTSTVVVVVVVCIAVAAVAASGMSNSIVIKP